MVRFAFSRATVLEMMHSIWTEINHLRHISQNPHILEQHHRRIELFNKDNGAYSGEDYSKDLRFYCGIIPDATAQKTNIDTTIDLLKSGKIVSFYDVFGKEEVKKLRGKINSLTEEITPRFHHRPGFADRDPEARELHKAVDCRNIATSAIISSTFDGYLAPFLCAPYSVRHKTFEDVKRSHFVPGFFFEALSDSCAFEDASIIVERMYRECLTCMDWFNRYTGFQYDKLPDFATRDIANFLLNYIDPLEGDYMKNEIDIKIMRDRIAGKTSSTAEFKNAVEEKGAEYIEKAREVLKSFQTDDEILEETGVDQNPRAKEVLSFFLPSKHV